MSIIKNLEKLFEENKDYDKLRDELKNNEIEIKELDNLMLLYSKDNKTELQRECNGIIVEKETASQSGLSYNVVCMCQNKIIKFEDLTINSQEDIENMHKNIIEKLESFDNYTMEFCEDGTIIRLYNYKDKWLTATTKCIDAKKSYWSSTKTFDDMFWETFKEPLSSLNKNYTYNFILLHKENRIVVPHFFNKLIYINSIDNKTRTENYECCFKNIKSVIKIEGKNINANLDSYLNSDKRGIIFKCYKDNYCTSYQYDFTAYRYIKNIRGNTPNIETRYLELINNIYDLYELERYYPEYSRNFYILKSKLNKMYKEIHKLYYLSHIKKELKVTEENKYFRTLKQLHAEYKSKGEIITLEKVIKKVNSLNVHLLKKLLYSN